MELILQYDAHGNTCGLTTGQSSGESTIKSVYVITKASAMKVMNRKTLTELKKVLHIKG
jgi:hypothetical protein